MQKPTKQDLLLIANKLLSKSGYSSDGSPRRRFYQKQKFFEKKVIIMTPMGNGRR